MICCINLVDFVIEIHDMYFLIMFTVLLCCEFVTLYNTKLQTTNTA